MDGIGAEQLSVKELLARLGSGEVKEVIMAMNPTVEGEATAMYLAKLIKPWASRPLVWPTACPWAAASSTPMRRRFIARSPAATSCKEQIL